MDPFGLVGKTLANRFVVEDVFTASDDGAIYRARLTGESGGLVALRCVRLGLALDARSADEFLRNFRDENQTRSRLTHGHPAFVPSIGSGMTTTHTGEHVPYKVLRWMDGYRSLLADMRIRREAGSTGRSPAEVVTLLSPVADALAYAHDNGVWHGSLAADGVMVGQGGTGTLLVDLGLARVVRELAEKLGQEAISVPPPRSIRAPEQLPSRQGGGGGPAIDVFGLAILALETMVDRPVLPANAEERSRLLSEPSTRLTPRAIGVEVGDRLESVFAMATSIDPGARPTSVRAFWTELDAAAQAASAPRIEAQRALADPIATPLAVSLPVGPPLPSSPDPVRDVSAITAGVGVVGSNAPPPLVPEQDLPSVIVDTPEAREDRVARRKPTMKSVRGPSPWPKRGQFVSPNAPTQIRPRPKLPRRRTSGQKVTLVVLGVVAAGCILLAAYVLNRVLIKGDSMGNVLKEMVGT